MNDNLKNREDHNFERKFGMTYEEFSHLSFDEQQQIVELNKKNNNKEDKDTSVIIGYGENSIVTDVKKSDKVMVRYGNVIEAGLTREESKKRLEKDIDDVLYSKPVALVKKLTRNLKRRRQ